MLQVQSPFQQFFDLSGGPLDNGDIYIGTAGQNPETNPIAIFWDSAGTLPAVQPLKTLNGYVVRAGSPAQVYVAAADFSMTAKDYKGRVVFNTLDATSLANAESVEFLQSGTGAILRTVQSKLREYISVTDYIPAGTNTATTNCSPYFQAAINEAAGRPILAPAATYRFETGLIYSTIGLGNSTGLKLVGEGKYKTIFDNVTGGILITCTSGPGLEFQYGTELESFSITDSSSSASSLGIMFIGVFQSSIFDVRVTQQGSHGIYMPSTIGDATDCSQIKIHACDVSDNGGWGIIAYGDSNAINSNIDVDRCRVISNTAGGIAFYSVVQGVIQNTAIAYNLGKGVVVGHAGGPYSKSVTIHNNEFDSNTGTQLFLDQIIGATVAENYFICNPASPVVTKQIDITANAQNILIDHAQPRLPPGYTGVTMFTVAGSYAVRILNTLWQSWEATGNTKYADTGIDTIILDMNEYLTTIQANKGIAFPATQVPSADPNVLDDYEEGSWTATFVSALNITGTPTFALGKYVKVGSLVTIEGSFTATVTATAGTNIIFGLPFPTSTAPSAAVGSACEINSIAVGFVQDTTGGTSDTATIWFPSLTAGAREIRFTYTYVAS